MENESDQLEKGLRRNRFGRRLRLILGYWLVQSVVVYLAVPVLLVTRLSDFSTIGQDLLDPGFALWGLSLVAVVTMLQWVFVIPVRPPGRHTGKKARVPIWTRLLLAASIATPVGVVGVGVQALWETYDTWPDPLGIAMLEPPGAFWYGWLIGLIPAIPIVSWLCRKNLPPIISACVAGCITGLLAFAGIMASASLVGLFANFDVPDWARALMLLGPFLIGWTISTPLLLIFIRKQDTETALQKLASLLFLGTAVELLAVIPIDVFVRRKSSCYCTEGSYLALVTLVPLGFVALGPMVFLVAASKRRKRWLDGRCEVCGYDMTATLKAERCPECGAGWKAPPQDAALSGET
jgi:hypothetical protein